MTMWYLWFALLIGIVITIVLVCKYNSRSGADLLPITNWSTTTAAKNLHDHYIYKPLNLDSTSLADDDDDNYLVR